MASEQSKHAIAQAFAERPDIAKGLLQILDARPTAATGETLAALAGYVGSLRSASRGIVVGNGPTPASPSDPASKKRKLQHATTAGGGGGVDPAAGARHLYIPDTSFSAPVRKKLRLIGTDGGIAGLAGLPAAANGAPPPDHAEAALAWGDVGWLFCLPVPDKAKPVQNFVAVARDGAEGAETLVWTAAAAGAGAMDALVPQLDDLLKKSGAPARKVILPSKDEFVSRVGKGGAYGTRAHRGSKEGYLFFLGPGILWAFKKPILFLPFDNISSISYTSVLQRTFNLVVTAREKGTDEETEIEFAMVDQDDFAGIDAYIKRHGLNDASLTASRRAKVYNVNAKRGAAAAEAGAEAPETGANAGVENGEGESELQKAEMMLQDEEDDLEEDYVDGEEEEDEEGSSDDESYDGEEGDGDDDGDEEVFEEEEEFEGEAGGYEDE